MPAPTGIQNLSYSIPNQQVSTQILTGPLRTSALRSLGAYANIFAIESFMDELAEKGRKDAFTFRIQHLKKTSVL